MLGEYCMSRFHMADRERDREGGGEREKRRKEYLMFFTVYLIKDKSLMCKT